ncbi:MAG: penicillin-binding transpeptidase domain-containing protein [Clostridiaceae bacterium]|nr:penicillin-binding transpeptidase domain-containing protein [Clostridiaceae bacterium]
MKQLLRNIKIVLLVFLVISAALLAGLIIQQHRSRTQLYVAAGENKAALKSRYAQAGTIYDRNGVVLAQSKNGERIYHEDKTTAMAVLQLVGDYTHNIDNTIEARYQSDLLGTDRNILHQFFLDIQGQGLAGDDITLTIDSALCKKAYQLLDGRKGAVVLLNYQTGAILASVSSPSTSPASVIAFKDIPDTALFNRAFLGAYAPGSTFKIITTAAYLQSTDTADLVVHCQARSTVDSSGADETGDGHGSVDLSQAFAKSCNVYFGQAGAALGRQQLIKTAETMSIGTTLKVDKLDVGLSEISSSGSASVLSWLAIGQPTADSRLSVSPLQMAMIAGAIGHQGVLQQAHIIDHLTNPLGMNYAQLNEQTIKSILSTRIAGELEELMVNAVKNGTGSAAAIKGYTVAGKTGTVQVDGQDNNALFVGYITDDQMPLAIAVIVEEGGSGGKTAAPIAAALLKTAVSALAG